MKQKAIVIFNHQKEKISSFKISLHAEKIGESKPASFKEKVLAYVKKNNDWLLAGATLYISFVAFFYFYLHGQENLAYYDAVARLNIARKMFDSITPGAGQLGGLWLPLPQLLALPFVWNDFLWHSGIAGYIVSGISFIVGAVYLQKTVYLTTHNRKVALLVWFLFVTNINVLLLQSMAMSEVFFLCFFILTCYNLFFWIKDKALIHFLRTAFCITVLTLTRYEGYFVFFGVFLTILIECLKVYSLRKKGNREKIEGMLLLFITLASFGILLWGIYNALVFKDPLFWWHANTSPPTSVLQRNNAAIDTVYGIQNPNLIQSAAVYSAVIVWTNGFITVLLGFIGIIVYCFKPIKFFFPIFLISVVVYLFLVIGYYKGFIPHIEFPVVLLQGIKARPWSLYADNNVRYGIVLLPCILFFVASLAARSRFFYVVAALFICEQVYFSVVNPTLFQYPFYKSWKYPTTADVPWFQAHYTGGLVLIAASRHEDFMFQSDLPYKDFIYEGTQQYWYTSMDHPATYARWVIFDDKISNDAVTLGLTQSGVDELKKKFQLVYRDNGFQIYQLKPQYTVSKI